jgi:mRNA interferase RelE/StbE
MAYYEIELDRAAAKSFSKLDNSVKKAIQKFLNRDGFLRNPKSFGKPLKHSLYGLWRYRISDYRIIADIQDDKLIILIVEIDHRKQIYQ